MFGSTEFDGRTDTDARFSPLTVNGNLVPVIYAGTDDRTAAAETIFRATAVHTGQRRVMLDRYRAWQWSQILPRRDLHLLPIGQHLTNAATLVDGDATTYPQARAAAAAVFAAHPHVDGFIWASRQLHPRPSTITITVDTPDACVLLVAAGDGRPGGIARSDLTADQPSVPFASPVGLERLDIIGDRLDITIHRT